MKLTLPKIYPITDTSLSGLSHLEQVRRLIDGGASLIQLRDKTASAGEFYRSALECVKYAHDRSVRVIINDRVDLALAVRADGVHLGQDDLPPDDARKLLGEEAVIGFSTHSIEQAREAVGYEVDYIAIGPIFSTRTKADHEAVVGLETLRRVRDIVGDLPLVAIGGICLDNAASVLEAGADSVAVISAVISEPDEIETRMNDLLKA